MTRIGIDASRDDWHLAFVDDDNRIMGRECLESASASRDEISAELRRIFERFDARGECVVGVGGRSLVIKHMLMQELERDEMLEGLAADLAPLAPFSMQDAIVDYSLVERVEQAGVAKQRLLAVAADRAEICKIVDIILDAGGEVAAVEPKPLGLLRYAEYLPTSNSGRFWYQIRRDGLTVAATAMGKILFWREIFQDFTQIGEAGVASEMAREGAVSEIVQSFDFFATKDHRVAVDEIYSIPALRDHEIVTKMVEESLGVDVAEEDPFDRFPSSGGKLAFEMSEPKVKSGFLWAAGHAFANRKPR